MLRQSSAVWICALALSSFVAPSSLAQVSITGTIVDPAGAVVPRASIQLTPPGRAIKRQTTSNTEGQFQFQPVSPGKYFLEIPENNGFKEYRQSIQVTRTPFTPITIHLVLASVEAQVNVDASQNEISTDPAENRDKITSSGDMLEKVPVFDQNYIAALTPFLSQAGIGTSGVSIVVDGVEMKGTGVSASAIKEARINSDPYSAESNRPGKGRIEIITKPGTPQFHGTFNFTFRDSALDATSRFALTRPSEQKRIYEGSITGPIGRNNKTTFLVSGTRQEDNLQAIVLLPDPNGPVSANVPTPLHDTELAFRVTHDLSPVHRISFQYNVSDTITRNQGVGGLVQAEAGVNAQAREDDVIFNDRLILSPTLINQFQLFFEKDHDPSRSVSPAQKIVVDGAFTGGGAQADVLTTENNLKINDVVSWSHGRHYLKFGVNIPNLSRRAWEDHANRQGTFNFSSLASYNAQQPYSFTQQEGVGRTTFWMNELGTFIQDQIQVRPDLQMSLGLRYDWQTYFNSPHNFSPRASLAYSLKDHKTVLRAGAGIFYDRSGVTPIADLKRYNGVILRSYTVFNPGYPTPLPPGVSTSSLPTNLVQLAPDVHMPYSAHYSAGVEHQLGKKATVAVTYQGSLGMGLFRSRDANAPLPPDYSVLPNPSLGVVRQIESKGRQASNAVDVTFEGEAGRWFSGIAQYTLSRTVNNTSGITWFPANQYDLSGEFSRADFDQRHRLNLLGTINEGHWLSVGLGVNLYSGTPYTETSGQDTFRTGILNARPAGVARNTLQSGGYADLDLRWSHDFSLTRRKDASHPVLSIAVDSFNLPNRVNYTSYVGNVLSSHFEQPTATQPARRLQMTARIKF
jgi:hypothetical protein